MVMFNGLSLVSSSPTGDTFSLPQQIIANKGLIIIGAGPKHAENGSKDFKQESKYRVDILFSGFAYISRRHAQLVLNEDGSCTIQDLASSNGLFVNRVRVSTQVLKDGDIVQFGGSKLIAMGNKIDDNVACVKYIYHGPNPLKRGPAPTGTSSKKKQKLSEEDVTQVEIARLQAELQSMKKCFREQGEIITQRNSTVLALTKDKDRIEQQHNDLKMAVKEMNRERAILRGDLARYKSNSAKLMRKLENQKKVVVVTDGGGPSAAPTLPSVVNQSSGIGSSTLHTSLLCTLCDSLLLDAVVLPCSHGFCRACIEVNWSGHAQKSKAGSVFTSNKISQCRCPRCNYTQKSDAKQRYVRSDHLDNMIWLLLEASPRPFQQDYEVREKKHRQLLHGVGVDPDAPLSSDDINSDVDMPPSDQEERVKGISHAQVAHKRDKAMGSTVYAAGAAVAAGVAVTAITTALSTTKMSTSPYITKNGQFRSTATAAAATSSSSSQELFCDFCGEDGHAEGSCPHRLYEMPGEDDNDDDDSSTGGTEVSEGDYVDDNDEDEYDV